MITPSPEDSLFESLTRLTFWAIHLEANYSKKLGLPGYSSHQYSVTIKTEVTDRTRSKPKAPGWPCDRCRRKNVRLSVLLALALALVGCTTSGGRDSWPGPTRPYKGKIHVHPRHDRAGGF
jgi:hypothetical protein